MFRLEIETCGAAFRDDSQTDYYGDYALDPSGCEVRRILKDISAKLKARYSYGYVMDVNGNKVGAWKYE